MKRLNLKSTLFSALIFALGILGRPSFAEVYPQSLLVQFSQGDLSSLIKSMRESISSKPYRGVTKEPFRTNFTFGNVTSRDIRYELLPDIQDIKLQNGLFEIRMNIRDFSSVIGRMEFTTSGSRYCADIPISTDPLINGGVIPITIQGKPVVSANGELSFEVIRSTVGLDNNNFIIDYPARCEVLFGANWLIKWILPSIIGEYRTTISSGIANALASALVEQTGSLSPLLKLNITLPFDSGTTPAFYADVSVKPFEVKLTDQYIRSTFATSVEIDPDVTTPFAVPQDWPEDISFFGVSWDFISGLFNQAQAKDVLKFKITSATRIGSSWVDSALWNRVWPGFNYIVKDQPLTLNLLGGKKYRWGTADENGLTADLYIENFVLELQQNNNRLAQLTANIVFRFMMTATEKGIIRAELKDIAVSPIKVNTQNSALEKAVFQNSGLEALKTKLRSDILAMPAAQREMINMTIPPVKLGSHQIAVNHTKAHAQGLLFPLYYVGPKASPRKIK